MKLSEKINDNNNNNWQEKKNILDRVHSVFHPVLHVNIFSSKQQTRWNTIHQKKKGKKKKQTEKKGIKSDCQWDPDKVLKSYT